jgi:lactoylglutathione lyase
MMKEEQQQREINVKDFIVGITVSDLANSRDWYSKLFGKKGPDLEPFPGNVEFKIGKAWVQIVKGEVKSSSWDLELEVLDLVREWERIRAAGIETNEIKTVPNVITFFDLKDPDGNKMRWFQVLTSDEKVIGDR